MKLVIAMVSEVHYNTASVFRNQPEYPSAAWIQGRRIAVRGRRTFPGSSTGDEKMMAKSKQKAGKAVDRAELNRNLAQMHPNQGIPDINTGVRA